MWCKQLTSASWRGTNELVVCLGRIPTPTHPTFSNARGKLTSEPLSSQRPSHQLLKAELPIIRRKREAVKRERRNLREEGRGRGVPGPALMGNAKPAGERPPPLEGNHLLADGTSLDVGSLNPSGGICSTWLENGFQLSTYWRNHQCAL